MYAGFTIRAKHKKVLPRVLPFPETTFTGDMAMTLFSLLLISFAGHSTSDAVFAQQFTSYVNIVRSTGCTCAGRSMPVAGPLTWHSKLEISATLHANQMMRYRFFEHYSRGGMDIGERAHAVGYPWQIIGENLARGQASIPDVIRAWIKSPEHCKVLMNPKFKEMGAARVGEYWVLHLGTRK